MEPAISPEDILRAGAVCAECGWFIEVTPSTLVARKHHQEEQTCVGSGKPPLPLASQALVPLIGPAGHPRGLPWPICRFCRKQVPEDAQGMMLGHLRGNVRCPGTGLPRTETAPYDIYSTTKGEAAPPLAEMLLRHRIANSAAAPAPTTVIPMGPTAAGEVSPLGGAAPQTTDVDNVGCTPQAVLTLVAILAAVLLLIAYCTRSGSSEPGNGRPIDRCTELKQWYAENPGDSDVDIAKDYWLFCREIPPPVVSGELSFRDIS